MENNVKYRLIMTYMHGKDVENVLKWSKLKYEVFYIDRVLYFVFRCGDKRYEQILRLAMTGTDATGREAGLPKPPGKKHHAKKMNRAFHYA